MKKAIRITARITTGITTGITARITRRKLAGVLFSFSAASSSALSSKAFAQTAAPADPLQAAKERIKATSDALAKEQIPMATEPAFQFKV
jgi:hypothetical protein